MNNGSGKNQQSNRHITNQHIQKPSPSQVHQVQQWTLLAGSMATPWNQICEAGRLLDESSKLDFIEPERSHGGKISRSEINFNVTR